MKGDPMANPVADHFAEILLDRISKDPHPSTTQMNMLEAVASPRMRLRYVLHLMDRVSAETFPSTSMLQRIQRISAEFGQ
jgi:hypothetical protein